MDQEEKEDSEMEAILDMMNVNCDLNILSNGLEGQPKSMGGKTLFTRTC